MAYPFSVICPVCRKRIPLSVDTIQGVRKLVSKRFPQLHGRNRAGGRPALDWCTGSGKKIGGEAETEADDEA